MIERRIVGPDCMQDIYFAIGMWGLAVVTVVAYLVRTMLRGRARFARTDADGGSVFLSKRAME